MTLVARRMALGVLAAAAGLGTGELVAGLLPAGRSPVVAVAERVIAVAPGGVVRAAIDALGTADKPVLVVGVVVVVLLAGAVAGVARPGVAAAVAAAFGALGAWAEVRSPDASALDALPPLLGAAVAVGVLRWLASPLAVDRPLRQSEKSRRTLLVGGTAAFAALAAGAGQALQRRVDAEASRSAVVLPRPGRPLPAVPRSASVGVDGVAPFVTPNDRFYRIDTALLVPQVEAASWTLDVRGDVRRPFSVTYDELLAMPMVEADVTLACVSNEVGDDLVGNARWLGVPVSALLDRAGVSSSADQLVGRSVDGFTAGMPLSVVSDGRDALVAVGMNGEPLPVRHGFPARLVVAGLYGYVSATKWLSALEVTRFDAFDPYWIVRGWAREGPIKEAARIDVVRAGVVAGVAWAHAGGGVDAVEVRVDDGPWRAASLGTAVGTDTWRQWRWSGDDVPRSGRHRYSVRCTAADGTAQTADVAPPFPSGATGWHTVEVSLD